MILRHGDDELEATVVRKEGHVSQQDVESNKYLGRILEQVRHDQLARDEETLRTGKATLRQKHRLRLDMLRRVGTAVEGDAPARAAPPAFVEGRLPPSREWPRGWRLALEASMQRSMSLATEYACQSTWRAWPAIFAVLPTLRGQTVIDLGCAVGDQAAGLVARGARVIGLDADEELLREARRKSLTDAEFRCCHLDALPDDLLGTADGMWCSFTAAYFPDLSTALTEWKRALRQGGFVAITEVDDLFGHEPLSGRARSLFDAHANDALLAKRYDFYMGRKLRQHLVRAGFTVSTEIVVPDDELSFDGPARPAVAEAWRNRFDRMRLFRESAGADFDAVRDEFLACLSRADHRSRAKIIFCVATKEGA